MAFGPFVGDLGEDGADEVTAAMVRMGPPVEAVDADIRAYREIKRRYAEILPRLRAVLSDA